MNVCVDARERASERDRGSGGGAGDGEGVPLHEIHGRQLRMTSLVVTLNENNSRNKSAASDLVDSVFAIFGITQNDRKRERAHALASHQSAAHAKTERDGYSDR